MSGVLGVCLIACASGGAKSPVRQELPAEGSKSDDPRPAAEATSHAGARARNEPFLEAASRLGSPELDASPAPRLAQMLSGCPELDSRLHRLAQLFDTFTLEHQSEPEPEELNVWLSLLGTPYLAPRIQRVRSPKAHTSKVKMAVDKFLSGRLPEGRSRCGGFWREESDVEVWTVVQVDALSDLTFADSTYPLGSRVRLEWRFHHHPSVAVLWLLSPSGRLERRNLEIMSGAASAGFFADEIGTYVAQVLSDGVGGPKPSAAALIGVGGPPRDPRELRAPGELGLIQGEPAEQLAAMVAGARRAQGRSELKREERLDRLAQAHTRAMVSGGRAVHDTGLGDPRFRVRSEIPEAGEIGENVARARDAVAIHRGIWQSPSHRDNMLSPVFTHYGVAVECTSQRCYATELFADLDPPRQPGVRDPAAP